MLHSFAIRADSFIADLGLAFNQDFDNPAGFLSEGTTYSTTGFFSYKAMQFLYLKKQWEKFAASRACIEYRIPEF